MNSVNTQYGNLIDGIGTQAHLSVSNKLWNSFNILTSVKAGGAGGVQAALTAAAGATGIQEVAITESVDMLR